MRNLFNKSRRSIFLSNFFRNIFYLFIFFTSLSLPANAQWYGALIPDFKVNDDITNYTQGGPNIGIDEQGNFVIIWTDYRNTPLFPLQNYCQRFTSDGSRLGINFRIGQDTSGGGRIAVLDNGNFITAWLGIVNGNEDIYVQRFFASGVPNGNPLKVNDTNVIGAYASLSDIDADSTGNFIVVWQDYRSGVLNPDVYGQRYDSAGIRIGNNFKINDNTNQSYQTGPRTAMNKDGSFVVCWNDSRAITAADIYMQRYDKFGSPIGANERIDDDVTNATQGHCDIATDRRGWFVVAFGDRRELANTEHTYYQVYDSLGIKQGANLKADVNVGQIGAWSPRVSMQSNGNFVIIWGDDRFNNNVPYGQRFLKNGNKIGINFRIPEFNNTPDFSFTEVFLFEDRIHTTWIDNRNNNWDIFVNVKSFINPDSILSAVNIQNEIATQYRLYPPYPNPFNPTVNIKYEISELTNVILRIIDINGREVTTLLNRKQSKGLYEIPFDGANYASGIYFVELITETGFKGISKIILLK